MSELIQSFPPEDAFIETAPLHSTISATTWGGSNQAIGVRLPKRAAPVTITNVGIYVGTASGNVDVGVYTWDGSQFVRQRSSGSTAASGSSAVQKIALSTPYVYDGRTDTWVFVAADNTTITLGRLSSVAAITSISNRVVTKSLAFPLPATISGTAATGSVWWYYGGV